MKTIKLSLLASALLASSTLSGDCVPENISINNHRTTEYTKSLDCDTSLIITETGSIDFDTVNNYAINILHTADHDLNIENKGKIKIKNTAPATTYGIRANNSDSDISITNSGEISIISDDHGYGISIHESSSSAGQELTIDNTGEITVESNKATYGINIDTSSNSSVNNSGKITVNSNSNSHLAVGLYVEVLDGPITNTGTITATIDGKADRQAFSIYTVSNGTSPLSKITNSGSGILNGNIILGAGTLTNSAKISLPYNADNAYIENFVNSSTGVLEIGVYSDDSQNITHSQLSTTNATFENGSTIAVNVLDNSQGVDLLVGEQLEAVVIASDGGLSVNGTLNITDNSALLDFEALIDNDFGFHGEDAIHLNIVEGSSIFDSVKAGGGQSPAQAAAKALDTIKNGNNPAMDPVFEALNKLPTDGAVANAVESTTPQNAGATPDVASQISGGIASIVQQRQNNIMGGGLNSGDEVFSQKNAWIKPFGSIGSQSDKDGLNGFDLKAYGVGMGIDGEYKQDQTIGVAFFYTNASVDVNNLDQSSDLDVFTTLLYGSLPVISNDIKLMYQLGYAWQKTDGQRTLFTGATATSKYTSKTASLDLKLVKTYQLSNKFALQPMVETTYRHFTSPSYTESGAGALNLEAQKFTSTELILGIGTLAHYKLNDYSKLIANINVGYDFHDRQTNVVSSYQGASSVTFNTNGIDNGRWNYDLGVGYEFDMNDFSNLNLSYNMQGQGTDFINNTISAKYVYKF